jgi:hypothetical protein
MATKATNINKTNNHLSSYLNSLNTRKIATYDADADLLEDTYKNIYKF